jgi:hypothetical protein
MAHSSPSEADPNSSIALTVRLNDPQHRAKSVKLFYRTGSRGKFDTADAGMVGTTARATVPSSAVQPPLVEYYFEAYDAGGLPIASRGDEESPLRVAVREPRRGGGWVLPVVIGGAVLGAAAVVGALALGGVFKGSGGGGGGNGGTRSATVSVTIRE